NAVKYSSAGSTVRVSLVNDGSAYRIHICDEGIGIPEQDVARLFQMFHRGSNVGRVTGTGLGLALAKLAVEAHGGSVSVASTLGAGTTFTVQLPHTQPH